MKNVNYISASLLLSAAVYTSPSSANEEPEQDILAHGGQLHTTECLKCHTDSVYTRDDRRVKSMDALGKQVRRCRDNIGLTWFDEDTEAVVQFLNTKYYKF